MKEFKMQVERIAQQCADILIAHKLVNQPATFKRKLKVDTRNTNSSWGGVGRTKVKGRWVIYPRITIAHNHKGKTGTFVEYARISTDPEIGNYTSDDPVEHVAVVVAHEMAHAAAHWTLMWEGTGHKSEWRRRYRVLRRELGLTSQ